MADCERAQVKNGKLQKWEVKSRGRKATWTTGFTVPIEVRVA